ncbi:cobalt transporter CbiM [Desulfobaculum bizertense]|uniref:Cobalt/nickel transport system permease protein n=1 Tax=Desulfobaculum bizertense DSM 18034 TaxID=1121442 RepID=A0A1T4WGS2_9BACT|nr:cobalt transporter CbiM [Desulfobaculum bizertense]UIJ39388.1 cobalt transporter CbiM [Desulfobaculum bizertense]SKA76534.1 cobalt/nickel transport system permease protein [Desulfobaculum bizertense DSM 18034]
MHISEGVLSMPVLLGGAVLAAAGTAVGLKKIDYDQLMRIAILSAVAFVASFIHVPVGPTSAHLVLNGLLGLLLGWAAFPAFLVSLTLQAVLFQFGGLTTLGVNTFDMAAPAVMLGILCRPFLLRSSRSLSVAAFCCGAGAVLVSGLLTAGALALSGGEFLGVAKALFIAHVPIAIIEGVISGFAVSFLGRVKPEVLDGLS